LTNKQYAKAVMVPEERMESKDLCATHAKAKVSGKIHFLKNSKDVIHARDMATSSKTFANAAKAMESL